MRVVPLLLCCFAAATAELKVMVPMRDGYNLSTYINCPIIGNKQKTAIYDTSVYGHTKSEEIATAFAVALGDEYCSVRQDMRGTKDSISGGQDFTLWRSQPNDSYDTFKWIEGQAWSNGEIYQVGASADGLAGLMSWEHKPPQLKKQFIMWATMYARGMTYPGGAWRHQLLTHWLKHFHGQTERLINVSKEHENPSEWWSPVNITWDKCDDVYFPSVFLAGWYDIFTLGNLAAHECYRNKGHDSYLIVQACGHCIAKDCPIYLIEDRKVDIAFITAVDVFAGRSPPSEIKNITFYVMGAGDKKGTYVDPFAPGNYWTSLAEWPVFTPVKYYMTGGMAMATEVPADGTTSFIYDPADPVATIGGNNLETSCGAKDQQNVSHAHRADVLDFTSEKLEEDLVITGPITATLFVSSNCTDTDFTAKLTHVHSDGRAILINDGIVRMRWRHGERGGVNPDLITPGQVYEVEVSLWNTSFIFPKGHQFRVSVSSSNYPRFEANPNNGKPMIEEQTPVFIAENTVHYGGSDASYFTMPVVTKEQLPKVDWNLVVDKWFDERPASVRTAYEMYKSGKESVAMNAVAGGLDDEL